MIVSLIATFYLAYLWLLILERECSLLMPIAGYDFQINLSILSEDIYYSVAATPRNHSPAGIGLHKQTVKCLSKQSPLVNQGHHSYASCSLSGTRTLRFCLNIDHFRSSANELLDRVYESSIAAHSRPTMIPWRTYDYPFRFATSKFYVTHPWR